MSNPALEIVFQNAAALRIIGLGTVSLLLLLTCDIYTAKVSISSNSVVCLLNLQIQSYCNLKLDKDKEDNNKDVNVEELDNVEDLRQPLNPTLPIDIEEEEGSLTTCTKDYKEKVNKIELPYLAQYREFYTNRQYI